MCVLTTEACNADRDTVHSNGSVDSLLQNSWHVDLLWIAVHSGQGLLEINSQLEAILQFEKSSQIPRQVFDICS